MLKAIEVFASIFVGMVAVVSYLWTPRFAAGGFGAWAFYCVLGVVAFFSVMRSVQRSEARDG